MDGDVRFKIAAARRILFRAGLDRDDIAGQVTARVLDEDALWTTPLELFDETMPDHVVKMPFGAKATANRVIEIDGEARPVTTASRWVEAIYRARDEVACVIHTHAPYIAAVASTGEPVQLYNNRSLVFVGQQAFYDDDGLLHHVGFCSSFTAKQRADLTPKIEKLKKPTDKGGGFSGRAPGGPSRWSTEL